jgi:hypothetical protein
MYITALTIDFAKQGQKTQSLQHDQQLKQKSTGSPSPSRAHIFARLLICKAFMMIAATHVMYNIDLFMESNHWGQGSQRIYIQIVRDGVWVLVAYCVVSILMDGPAMVFELFGWRVEDHFRNPFLSASIQEFWGQR